MAVFDHQLFVNFAVDAEETSVKLRVFDISTLVINNSRVRQFVELDFEEKGSSDVAICDVPRRVFVNDANIDDNFLYFIDWPLRATAADVCDDDGDDVDDVRRTVVSYPVNFFTVSILHWATRLSITTNVCRQRQLVVTPHVCSPNANSLFVYNVDDGKQIREVQLAPIGDDVTWTSLSCAVQSAAGNSFYVCRYGKNRMRTKRPYRFSHTHVEVAEYDVTGTRIRCYYSGLCGDGPHQLTKPQHLSLIDGGRRLLVVDVDTRRVLLLNSELRLERFLLTDRQLNGKRPQYVCYDVPTGLLFVGMSKPRGRVEAYQFQ